MAYSEFRYFSPVHDTEMIRLSMWSNGEFFSLIPAADGKRYRERRDEALDMIEEAIRIGLEPGEVVKA